MTDAVAPLAGKIIPHAVLVDLSKQIPHKTVLIAAGEAITATQINQLNDVLASKGLGRPIGPAVSSLVVLPVDADPADVAEALSHAGPSGGPRVVLHQSPDADDDAGAFERGRIIPHS